MSQAQVPLPFSQDQSANLDKQKAARAASLAELKIPQLQFASPSDPGINFQHQACKLIQANTILSELIKDSVIEKYTLSEKIHMVLEQIKKLQAKNAVK